MANKYKAVKTVVNGKKCDSKLEATHYHNLLMLEKARKITSLKFHPRYPVFIDNKKICTVVLDFEFYDVEIDKTRYIDSKGVYTSESKLRHKLFEATYGKKVEIWRK